MKNMIKRNVLSTALCLIALIFALPTAMFAQAGMSIEAEEHILNELRRAGIPNAAVAVIQDEETSFILKNSELDTVFEIASVTKPFTAFGVLLLEDMGLLSVYDPVNQHLPWFKVHYNGMPVPHEDISIYNLIHHTSGLSQNENRFPRAALTETTDEFIARLIGMELDFYPSTNVVYSNMGYIILGLLIEAVSGQPYEDFMIQQVLHPIGLYNTFTNTQRARTSGQAVNGYVRGFLQVRQGAYGIYTHSTNIPTGGIYSSVADLARWAGIQLGIVEVSEQFARVVQRSHTLHYYSDVIVADSGSFFSGGWFINEENGSIEHMGDRPTWAALIRILPENNTAVVVLANLRLWVDDLGTMPLEAVLNGTFTTLGRDWNQMSDIFFSIVCAVGIIYIGLFVRIIVKLRKRLKSGEVIKANFSAKSIKKLISGSILSIAFLTLYYIFPYVLMGITRASLINNFVTSFGVAAIAMWIMVLYDVFAWWTKMFVSPK